MDATASRAFSSPLVLILLPLPLLTASSPAFLFKVEVLLSFDVLFDARRVLFWQRSNPWPQCCCVCLCLADLSLSLVEMPLLPPLLPSTPAPPLFCRLLFSPPSAVLLLLPPIHQLNPLHVIQAWFSSLLLPLVLLPLSILMLLLLPPPPMLLTLLYLPLPALIPLPLL
jgi:hypothetical protein